jgi:hypothetical protein
MADLEETIGGEVPAPPEPEAPVSSSEQEAGSPGAALVPTTGSIEFHPSEVISRFPAIPEPGDRVDAYNFTLIRVLESRTHELQFRIAQQEAQLSELQDELKVERVARIAAEKEAAVLVSRAESTTEIDWFRESFHVIGGVLLFIAGAVQDTDNLLGIGLGVVGIACMLIPLLRRKSVGGAK